VSASTHEQLYLRCLGYLEREEALQAQLLEFAQTMRQCLVQGDLGRLQAMVRSSGDLWRVRNELAREREELISDAAVWLRFAPERSIRLRDIAEQLPSPWSEALLERAESLLSTVRQIEELTAGNTALLRHHQELLRQVLALLVGDLPPADTYSPAGREARAEKGLVVRTQG